MRWPSIRAGRLIAGTGQSRERSIASIRDHSYTRLLNVRADAGHRDSATAPDGRIYAVTGNIGEIFSIGPELETSGTFESDVFDAGAFSYWGRLT